MNGRRGLVALLGAGLLTVAAIGTATATQPTYLIEATKTADPPVVPVEGGDVTFTVSVEATGTGSLGTVVVTDPLAGCTLGAPTGDDGNGTLDPGETWDYRCTVQDVTPGTENTATVDACHNTSPDCQQDPQRASDEASLEVGLCESDCPTPSPTDTDSGNPSDSGGGGGATDVPPTDALGSAGSSGPADSAWYLVVALGGLLGSLVVLRPSSWRRHR